MSRYALMTIRRGLLIGSGTHLAEQPVLHLGEGSYNGS